MKRIAMITHHWVPNFGANLQSLSTFLYLTKLGHEVSVLNYRPFSLEQHSFNTVCPEQIDMHNQHCDRFLNQSPLLRSEQELTQFCKKMKFDNIIAGSDSILRIKKSVKTEEGRFPNPFWLLWAKEIKDISKCKLSFLSASCEGSYYFFLNSGTRRKILSSLRTVDNITVRDRWTKDMLRYASEGQIDPAICSDPVSILNDVLDANVCNEFFSEAASMRGQYLLLCVSPRYLTPSWCKRFVDIANALGQKVFALPLPSRETNLPVDRILQLPMAPLTWYGWIKNAAGIITVNFHPVACSVINEVPFISIDISGPMYFRAIALRRASKTYDLCMNVKAESHSFLPLQARCFLSPRKAMNLLNSCGAGYNNSYIKEANDLFKRTIANIVDEN